MDRLNGIIAVRSDGTNLFHQFQIVRDFPKDGMGAGRRLVEPVEEGIVCHVDKELASARLGLAGIGHAERANIVGDFGSQFVGNAAAGSAGVGFIVAAGKGGAGVGAASAGASGVGVLGVGALLL